MKPANVKFLLVVLVLILAGILLRDVHFFYAYSTQEIQDESPAILSRYNELKRSRASAAEWGEFEQSVQERLAPIVEDLSVDAGGDYPIRQELFKLLKHNVPRAIRSKGSADLDKVFAESQYRQSKLRDYLDTRHEKRPPRQQTAEKDKKQDQDNAKPQGLDPVVTCVLLFDGLLAVGVVYLLWPAGKKTRRNDDKEPTQSKERLEHRLSVLDKKIAQDPRSASSRGLRAKLRAQMGLHEEALADIDWILETEPHGVDLETWYDFRERIAAEMEKH